MTGTPSAPDGAPRVTILMAVRNGARHLPCQLDSLAAQTAAGWRLVAGDDGSTDGSRDLLGRFAERHPVEIRPGPQQGFARNFLALLAAHRAPGPVALADQDDIWFPDKLARALEHLARVPPGQPGLYCSARLNWQPGPDRRIPSRPFPRPPCFANALVENIAFGNTIVLNEAAARAAQQTAAAASEVPFHDWWLYLLVSGIGGTVIHDPRPGLLYRQHEDNAVGSGGGLGARLRGDRAALRGSFAERIGRNLRALDAIAPRLTPGNRAVMATFVAARRAGLPRRLWLMRQSGVHRQHRTDGIRLWGAVCLGRV